MSENPPSVPSELLEHTGFLRALARRLLHDDGASEDVVQEAYAEVLRTPPGTVKNPMGWMVRTVRNLALDHRRSEGRRERRERAHARPEAQPSTADLAARESSLRAVTETVLALDEPYRSVVLQHYHEGLSLAEIARRAGEPLATVRSRHVRALERLRRDLDAHHDGDRRAWSVGLAGLVGDAATTAPVPRSRASLQPHAGFWAGIGAVLTTGLAALGLWLALPVSTPRGPDPAAPAIAAVPAEPRALVQAPSARTTVPVPSPASSVEDAAPPTGRLTAQILWADGTPAAGIDVALVHYAPIAQLTNTLWARSEEDGRVRYEGLAEGKSVLFPDRGRVAGTAEIAPGAESTVTVSLLRGVDVEGRVLDEAGVPVPGAEIWLTSPLDTSAALPRTRADGRGRFALRCLATGTSVEARAPGRAPSPALPIVGPEGERTDLVLVLQGAGSALDLHVIDPEGRAAAGARVRLASESTDPYPRRGMAPDAPRGNRPQRADLVLDAEGRLRVEGLPPGPTRVTVAASGSAPLETTLELLPGGRRTLDLTLSSGLTVTGIVRTSRGVPVPDVGVTAEGAFLVVRNARTGADGRFTLAHVAPGEVRLAARHANEGKASIRLRGGDGARLTWDPVLDPGLVFAGRLVDDLGLPLAGWEVEARVSSSGSGAPTRFTARARSGPDGRFAVLGCPEDSLRVLVRAPEGFDELPVQELEGLSAGTPEQDLVVPQETHPSAWLVGTTLGANGAPSPAFLRLETSTGFRRATRGSAPETGAFRLGPLVPRTYTLQVSDRDGHLLSTRTITLDPGQELDLGRLGAD